MKANRARELLAGAGATAPLRAAPFAKAIQVAWDIA
jgi:hypothetical protein